MEDHLQEIILAFFIFRTFEILSDKWSCLFSMAEVVCNSVCVAALSKGNHTDIQLFKQSPLSARKLSVA